ncbi:aminotransferase-like domain-containing protein [Leisingera caerulea]|uniref:aminotransferase-like domain-containing protein n=1 Tax=Leisingera caerulea TaxID=506591 RepID=UPI00041C51F0|nr:PLP-dependent aminotransferase family protein [Leisingera caerulea]UWQ50869.1 PLP-dependent aminotransferase family protein [Leisingera caerulea]UWQ63686.1 PLP-dependent aminotransferase family protein [Leisingera caerulea]UWQ84595.1 PLP-dependent aminotransferase family protein [Leisingera caerulea]
MKQWTPARLDGARPRYLELAEAIKSDIDAGVLEPGDRLPPQRRVAQELGLDFSTVSRGYAEAVRRGYIESFVGRGTYVRAAEALPGRPDPRRALEEDPKMNMPPEPDDPALLARMQKGLAHVAANLQPLLRYQSVTGSPQDRATAADWMQANGLPCVPERLVITPGAHASIYAILTVLCEPGSTVLCEDVTYPGLRSIAARLGIRLIGLAGDKDGVQPDALEKAITGHWPAALYLNPTLQNPTTRTMPAKRRQEIAAVLQKHDLPLIEDDAYCFVDNGAPQAVSSLIPDLGWHIAGLSKCFGAGLRLAYTTVPQRAVLGQFSQALRSMHVMVSPLNLALLGRWIEDGTAAAIQKFIRKAAAERQALAGEVLKDCFTDSDPLAFNRWLTLPRGTSRAEVMGRMAGRQIGIMPSDAFTVTGLPQEAVRVCLGGPIGLEELRADLIALNDAVNRKDWLG